MRTVAFAMVLAVTGCAHVRESEMVCPEHRDIRCVLGVECSYDRTRGCEACRCLPLSAGDGGAAGGRLPPADAPR